MNNEQRRAGTPRQSRLQSGEGVVCVGIDAWVLKCHRRKKLRILKRFVCFKVLLLLLLLLQVLSVQAKCGMGMGLDW